MPPHSLEDAYHRVCDTPSDINQHCPTLRRLAQQCKHATEFGVRYGNSTIALLAGSLHGSLRRLVSYDVQPLGPEKAIAALAPDILRFMKGNSLEVTIDETDLLFVDTKHTGGQLKRELFRHHGKVRRWIALHDTRLCGETGERGRHGLTTAIMLFTARTEWVITEHYDYNCGLTILEKRNARHGTMSHVSASDAAGE